MLNWATSRALAPNQRWALIHSVRTSSETARREPRSRVAIVVSLDEEEPEEAAGGQGEQVGEAADPGEAGAPEHLLGVAPLVGREVELDRLGRAGEVVDAEDDVVLVAADVGEDPGVGRREGLVGAEAEHRVVLA